MASPQLENGFTPIAHELFQAFYNCKMVEYERVIVMHLWRKTYGWGKKEDWISNSQFSEETGVPRPHVTRTLKVLKEKKIITQRGKKLSVNKHYDEWNVVWRVTSPGNRVTSPGNEKLPHQVPTKEIKHYTKESNPLIVKTEKYIDYETGEEVETKPKSKTGSAEVIALVNLFAEMGERAVGVKPDLTRAYFKVIRAMQAHKLSPENVKDLYQYFFRDTKLSDEKKVSLGLCISGAYISQWKVSQRNKTVSQVEASLEIKL